MKRTLSYSYNPHNENGLKKLLVPSKNRLILDFVLGVLLIVAINVRSAWQLLSGWLNSNNRAALVDLTENQLNALNENISELIQGRFTQFLVWLFFGCLVYLGAWVIAVFLTNIRNDIVADQYEHPKSYDRSRFWISAIGHKLLFFSVAIVFVAYIYAGLRIAVVLSSLFYQSLANFQPLKSSLTVLVILLVSALLVQVFFILKPLFVNSWNFIYKGL